MTEKATQLLRILQTARNEVDIQQVCKILEVNEREFRKVLRELEKARKVKVSLRVEVL